MVQSVWFWISAGCSGDKIKLQESVDIIPEREAVPAFPALGISETAERGLV